LLVYSNEIEEWAVGFAVPTMDAPEMDGIELAD
jgi:hypothetical protein